MCDINQKPVVIRVTTLCLILDCIDIYNNNTRLLDRSTSSVLSVFKQILFIVYMAVVMIGYYRRSSVDSSIKTRYIDHDL